MRWVKETFGFRSLNFSQEQQKLLKKFKDNDWRKFFSFRKANLIASHTQAVKHF